MTALLDPERCWQTVLSREVNFDGSFYYGVMTTGVYCRPGCPSRLPLRMNVRFYATTADAGRDGLRACKRCRPLALTATGPLTERMRDLCRHIEQHAGSVLTLDDLSRQAQLSKYHLQRSFKAIVGVSPKQYLDHVRMEDFKEKLRDQRGSSITGAIFDAGFGSLSHDASVLKTAA